MSTRGPSQGVRPTRNCRCCGALNTALLVCSFVWRVQLSNLRVCFKFRAWSSVTDWSSVNDAVIAIRTLFVNNTLSYRPIYQSRSFAVVYLWHLSCFTVLLRYFAISGAQLTSSWLIGSELSSVEDCYTWSGVNIGKIQWLQEPCHLQGHYSFNYVIL